MKICLVVDSFLPDIGGLQFAVHYLSEALMQLGCGVTVIAKESRNKKTQIPLHSYDIVRYGFRFPGSGRTGADNLSAVKTILSENKKRNFDLLHCHNVTYAANRSVWANHFLNLPLIMTPHGDDIETVPEYNYGIRLNQRWDRTIQKNLKYADIVTTINAKIQEEMVTLPQEKMRFIPNGINLKLFDSTDDPYLYEILNLEKDKKIVLSTGRNHIIKGFEFGIACFKIIYENFGIDDLVYVIVGEDTPALSSAVERSKLGGKVFLLDNQSQTDLSRCYRSAWCFLSPSIIEGFSLVSLEAMASGLPLVLTDVPGNRDIVDLTQCGILAENKNPHSMAEGIISLYNSTQLYGEQKELAKSKISEFDWLRIGQMYIDVYKETIGNATKRTYDLQRKKH